MKYYWQTSDETFHRPSPMTQVLLRHIEEIGICPSNVLDLASGNGRNSFPFASRYGSEVVLVDIDHQALSHAQSLFRSQNLPPPQIVQTSIETLAKEGFRKKVEQFDVVMLCYALNHVQLENHVSILEFCKRSTRKFFVAETYWNFKNCPKGEYIVENGQRWYGMPYKHLASMIAPHFMIAKQQVKIRRKEGYATMHFLCMPGSTPDYKWKGKIFDYSLLPKKNISSRRRAQKKENWQGTNRAKHNVITHLNIQNKSNLFTSGQNITLADIGNELGLPEDTMKKSDEILEQISQNIPSVKDNRIRIACSLFLGSELTAYPVTLRKIIQALDPKMATKQKRKLLKTTFVHLRTIRHTLNIQCFAKPDNYVSRILEMFKIETKCVGNEINRLLANQNLAGRNTKSIAAGIAFILAEQNGKKLKMKTLAQYIGISEVTIRNTLKILRRVDSSN